MAERVSVVTELAPPAKGPYSQAIKVGDFIYVSAQLPQDPRSGDIVGNDIGAQTDQCLKNLSGIFSALGGQLSNILKTTVYLTSLNDMEGMNKIYQQYFSFVPPARTVVEVSGLPHGALIAVEAIAHLTKVEIQGGLLI
jgi:2-iminobutanoate/2-iminopropanoate deaminase